MNVNLAAELCRNDGSCLVRCAVRRYPGKGLIAVIIKI